MAKGDKKDEAIPRRNKPKAKGPSTAALLGVAGGGAVAGTGVTLGLQKVLDTDDRVISGVTAGVGVVTTIAGLAMKNPYVAAAGAGITLSAGGICASDTLWPAGAADEPRNADTQQALQEVRNQLQQLPAAKRPGTAGLG